MKRPADSDTAKLADVRRHLDEMTDTFCASHLSAEYKRLCRKVTAKYAREKPSPLLRGALDLWAAGIVHALCSANYAFDKSSEPHIRAAEISEHFGTNPRSTAQKAAQIREAYGIGYEGDITFLTKRVLAEDARRNEALRRLAPRLLESLPDEPDRQPTAPTRDGGEFIDGDHPVMTRYYALLERYESSPASPLLQAGLEEIVHRDPDFYDPYLLLADIHKGRNSNAVAAELLETAYQRALARIVDKKGDWPRALHWGWLENRHIIRTILNKAMALWQSHDSAGALDIFRRLLRTNPGDNAGAREYILAIRLGLSYKQFEKKFASPFGYDGNKLFEWFEANVGKFPEEFEWWQKLMETERE